MNPVTLAVDALAAARLTRLVTEDAIADRPRNVVKMWSAQRKPGQPGYRIVELLECGWCSGMWCAGAVLAARTVAPGWWDPIARGLALAQVAGMLNDAEHVVVAEDDD